MTNFERIKAMSVEKMAEMLGNSIGCDFCMAEKYCEDKQDYNTRKVKTCGEIFKEWLQQEVSDERD